jgi:hypothetical protein
MESFKYNEVTIAPANADSRWQPEPGQTFIHRKNGKDTPVMLVELDNEWQAKLFDYMSKAHNLTLTETELSDIRAVLYPLNLGEGEAIVNSEQLNQWIEAIKSGKQFRSEVETDIGWVAESLHNLMKGMGDSPMKLVSKAMMGKLNPAELGLDIDRLQAIGAKYAPETIKKLQSQNS